jgi:hypothetical protein
MIQPTEVVIVTFQEKSDIAKKYLPTLPIHEERARIVTIPKDPDRVLRAAKIALWTIKDRQPETVITLEMDGTEQLKVLGAYLSLHGLRNTRITNRDGIPIELPPLDSHICNVIRTEDPHKSYVVTQETLAYYA